MILPAMGIASDILSTLSRKPIFSYRAMASAMVAIGFLGFIVWGPSHVSERDEPDAWDEFYVLNHGDCGSLNHQIKRPIFLLAREIYLTRGEICTSEACA